MYKVKNLNKTTADFTNKTSSYIFLNKALESTYHELKGCEFKIYAFKN